MKRFLLMNISKIEGADLRNSVMNTTILSFKMIALLELLLAYIYI